MTLSIDLVFIGGTSVKRHRIHQIVAVIISFVMLLILFTACGEKDSRGYDDSLISPEWSSERLGRSNPNDFEEGNPENKVIGSGSSYPVVLSLEEIVEMSSLVIRGRVLGFDYLTIREAGSDTTMPHTDYYIEILDVLRGEPYDEKQIIVRAEGGENEELIARNEDLCLNVGDEYVFFLWMPKTVGTGYHTDGNYYETVYQNIGLFNTSRDRAKNADGITVPKKIDPYYETKLNNEEYDYLRFIELMKTYNERIPINENFFAESYEGGLAANLESGFITREEYDRGMAGLRKYATIVNYFESGKIEGSR